MQARPLAGVPVATLALLLPAVAAAQTAPSLDAFGLLVAEQSRPSFAVVGAGARAAGMGGAFTALADDASAASFNPAGLALLVRPEASIVLDGRRRSDDHASFLDLEEGVLEMYDASSSSFDDGDLNFASFTYPVTVADRNLTVQLSYHRQIDFTFESDRRFDERLAGAGGTGPPIATLEQRIDQEGDVSTLSLAAAYQLTPRTSLGLTLSRWSGEWSFSTLTRETEFGEGPPGGAVDSLRYSQDNSWSGWNASLGVLLRYRYLNVGATGRTEFDGDYDVSSRLQTSFDTPFDPTSTFSGTLHWPSSWTVGLALKPLETWVVTADYAEFDWDDLRIEGLTDEPVNFFDLRPEATTTAGHGGQWRFGTEVTLLPGRNVVGLRAGYFTLPRPVRLAPPGESNSIDGYALGVGWKRGPVSLDLAYQRTDSSSLVRQFVDPETVATGQVNAQAEGTVEGTEERLFLSVLYQFESRDALRRLGHFLFVGPLERDEPDEPDEADGPAGPIDPAGAW
ncbi:MAG: UPF0164 family protein [Acidobacteriota bacterium]|jgi:hypothetical protein